MHVLEDKTTSRGRTCQGPDPDREYPPHPRAQLMPDLPRAKYDALKLGIQTHGLQYPIRVQKGTKLLLDGRHRLRACRELGLTPRVDEIDIADDQVAIYTGAEAAKRDGLTKTEKALFALDLLPAFEERAAERQRLGAKVQPGEKGKSAYQAATLVGVSARYVQYAVRLHKDRPDLLKLVHLGELSLAAAIRATDGRPPKPKKARPEDRFSVPDYLRPRLTTVTEAAVGDGTLGEGIEALLDFIDSEGKATWERWVEARTRVAA